MKYIFFCICLLFAFPNNLLAEASYYFYEFDYIEILDGPVPDSKIWVAQPPPRKRSSHHEDAFIGCRKGDEIYLRFHRMLTTDIRKAFESGSLDEASAYEEMCLDTQPKGYDNEKYKKDEAKFAKKRAAAAQKKLQKDKPKTAGSKQKKQSYTVVETFNQAAAENVEKSEITVVKCLEEGKQFYVYKYFRSGNKANYRVILPPAWGNPIGGKDVMSFKRATELACPNIAGSKSPKVMLLD